ncbi:MAG: hypothetical protein Q8Q33_05015 [Chlamydiota bacterium]|nr:hypothetical protein [Chlamydiota bacterium]
MTIDILRQVFLWSSVIHIGCLLWWFIMIVFTHDLVYRLHSKWFKVSVETFDAIHYAGIAFYKICIFVFSIIPYVVLVIIS